MKNFFNIDNKVTYEGPKSSNQFSFKHYNPDEIINQKKNGRSSSVCSLLLA